MELRFAAGVGDWIHLATTVVCGVTVKCGPSCDKERLFGRFWRSYVVWCAGIGGAIPLEDLLCMQGTVSTIKLLWDSFQVGVSVTPVTSSATSFTHSDLVSVICFWICMIFRYRCVFNINKNITLWNVAEIGRKVHLKTNFYNVYVPELMLLS